MPNCITSQAIDISYSRKATILRLGVKVELHDAQSLAEFVKVLMEDQGDSFESLAAKSDLSHSTLHRLAKGKKADDKTLDKLADYAGVTRDWLYALAKGTSARPRHSAPISLMVALLERAPIDDQEEALTVVRAILERRKKKKPANADHNLDELAGT